MRIIEGGKAVSILGFRDIKIDDVERFLKRIRTCTYPAVAQIVDATVVAGEPHLFVAFLNAQKSFEAGRAISENLEMETLLYASGKRQINKAIDMLGIKPQLSNIALVIFALSENEVKEAENKLIKLFSIVQDETVLEVKGKVKVKGLMKTFGVTELEVKTMAGPKQNINEVLTWLIVERVSLLSVNR